MKIKATSPFGICTLISETFGEGVVINFQLRNL